MRMRGSTEDLCVQGADATVDVQGCVAVQKIGRDGDATSVDIRGCECSVA